MQRLATLKNIEIVIINEQPPISVNVDRMRIQHILITLIQKALKYSQRDTKIDV